MCTFSSQNVIISTNGCIQPSQNHSIIECINSTATEPFYFLHECNSQNTNIYLKWLRSTVTKQIFLEWLHSPITPPIYFSDSFNKFVHKMEVNNKYRHPETAEHE